MKNMKMMSMQQKLMSCMVFELKTVFLSILPHIPRRPKCWIMNLIVKFYNTSEMDELEVKKSSWMSYLKWKS